MTILIIEDERPAYDRLVQGIRNVDVTAQVLGPLASVHESVDWLKTHPAPDLVLADIQLSDGLSLDIFRSVELRAPIVFITAFDEYILEALQYNSIDYLLKPVKQEKLAQALRKYQRLEEHFTTNLRSLLAHWERRDSERKDRLVVRKGIEFVSVRVEEVAYFYTEHKLVFLVDREGKKYIVDSPLADLESTLDEKRFFRLNRKYLANITAVHHFASREKGKVRVELVPSPNEEIIVSQENGATFRKWMGA